MHAWRGAHAGLLSAARGVWYLRQGSAAHAHAYNSDEINSLALSPSGRFLAAADDAGEVRVVDVRSGALYKTLRGGHSNIASGSARMLLSTALLAHAAAISWPAAGHAKAGIHECCRK
jgi:WD40 repeat protein